MPVHLVRHAQAGSRSRWSGDDAARPLSPKGHEQAATIAALLAGQPITYLGSSPAVRCIETLAPLVPPLELDVHILPELAEGAGLQGAVSLVLSFAKQTAALCAHGDLIPPIVENLIERGMAPYAVTDGNGASPQPIVGTPILSQKGSVWTIEFDGETPTTGTYHPPA